MKKWTVFLVVVLASFVGVFAALRLDRMAEQRRLSQVLDAPDPVALTEAQFSPGGAPFDFRAAAKKIMPAVVSVDRSDEVRDFFTDSVSTVNTGTGSGVIISNDGYILTNNHVIAGAANLTVRTLDGKSYPAKMIGTDPRTDLGVIKIEGTGLVAAELSNSASLEVGEWVMAVGNPLGYSNTLSVGVVSSLNRTLQAGRRGTLLVDAIQTDAAINSGNSGGALTNDRGQVVGINSAIATNSGGSIGIGFAIPINRAKKVVQEIVKFGHVRYGYSGFEVYEGPVTLQDPQARAYLERTVGAAPPSTGLILTRLDPTGPASRAGLKQLDILIEADGKKLSDPTDLRKVMLDKKVGDKVSIKLWSGGSTRSVSLTLAEDQQ